MAKRSFCHCHRYRYSCKTQLRYTHTQIHAYMIYIYVYVCVSVSVLLVSATDKKLLWILKRWLRKLSAVSVCVTEAQHESVSVYGYECMCVCVYVYFQPVLSSFSHRTLYKFFIFIYGCNRQMSAYDFLGNRFNVLVCTLNVVIIAIKYVKYIIQIHVQ